MAWEFPENLAGYWKHFFFLHFTCQDYPSNILRVDKISSKVLGKEIAKRCGNEGHHGNLSEDDQSTLKFLRAAISFISNANDMCADLTNAAFIIWQPGKEFIIQARNGDWEFFFSDGHCVREGPKQFSSNKDYNSFIRNLFSWWLQSPNTAVRRPLVLTCEVQELTSNVTLPKVTEEETRKTHSTDASSLTISAHIPFVFLFKDYWGSMIFYVKKIWSMFLGGEITKRCGNEGQHNDLEER